MKKILTVLSFFATTTALGQQLPWIPFTWAEGKSAMLVPVTLDKLPHQFDMQLDLGAVTTVVYGEPFAPYLTHYPAVQAKFDSTRTFIIQGQKNGKLVGVDLRLGKIKFGARDIGVFNHFGNSLTDAILTSPEVVTIGTIAPDLF